MASRAPIGRGVAKTTSSHGGPSGSGPWPGECHPDDWDGLFPSVGLGDSSGLGAGDGGPADPSGGVAGGSSTPCWRSRLPKILSKLGNPYLRTIGPLMAVLLGPVEIGSAS